MYHNCTVHKFLKTQRISAHRPGPKDISSDRYQRCIGPTTPCALLSLQRPRPQSSRDAPRRSPQQLVPLASGLQQQHALCAAWPCACQATPWTTSWHALRRWRAEAVWPRRPHLRMSLQQRLPPPLLLHRLLLTSRRLPPRPPPTRSPICGRGELAPVAASQLCKTAETSSLPWLRTFCVLHLSAALMQCLPEVSEWRKCAAPRRCSPCCRSPCCRSSRRRAEDRPEAVGSA